MQMFKSLEQDDAALVGWGVSVLLASASGEAGHTARRLAGLGGNVEVQGELYDALSSLLDDPRSAQMLVIDCESYGGLSAGRRAFSILAEEVPTCPVVLIASEVREQTFPQSRDAPIILRAPVSAVALRIAFETAFRGKLVVCGA